MFWSLVTQSQIVSDVIELLTRFLQEVSLDKIMKTYDSEIRTPNKRKKLFIYILE